MPEQVEPAPAGAAPAATTAPAATDGLPAAVQQALADIPDLPNPADASATPAPEPKTDPAPEGEPKAEGDGAAPAEPKQESPAITAEAVKAALDAGTLTPEDVARIPGMDGWLGQRLQRLRKQEQDDATKLAQQARKFELAESDPDHPLSREVLTEKQQLENSNALGMVQNQVFGQMVQAIGTWVGEKLPDEVVKEYREKVAGQNMTLPELVDRIHEVRLEHFKTTEVPKLVQAGLEAKWKDYQAERLGGEPSPQTDQPSKGGTRQITQKEIDAMDWRDYAKVEPDIMAGRIKLVAA